MSQSKVKEIHLTCDCCRDGVLLSAALTPPGMDYVYHFCGTDCYQKWCAQQNNNEPKNDKTCKL